MVTQGDNALRNALDGGITHRMVNKYGAGIGGGFAFRAARKHANTQKTRGG
ncbi:hypothetical protein GCM10025785_00980 [Corynebacterium canis]